MLRASLLVFATALVVLVSVVVACNDVETKDAPDAGHRVCDPGPFTFDRDGNAAVGLSAKPSEPACSADGTNLDVINRLPRGGWFPVGWSAQTVGTQDTSGQGECKVITVCKCVAGTTTTPPAPETDAGADAAPAPAPTPTKGEPQWQCG
jgi:hypothetical protein